MLTKLAKLHEMLKKLAKLQEMLTKLAKLQEWNVNEISKTSRMKC